MIQTAGVGLPANSLTLTFTSSGGAATTCSLPSCVSDYAVAAWPPATANAPGQVIEISGVYQFHSAMAMFWPGNQGSSGSPAIVNLAADARESMQF